MGAPINPVVWHLSDGRKGHDNQSLGLIDALNSIQPLQQVHLAAARPAELLGIFFSGKWPNKPPKPDLIIAAGHATHLSALLAGFLFQAKTIVLMRPGLPRRWFDYCLLPAHDGCQSDHRTLITEGPLNKIQASPGLAEDKGLILVGGPSRHYDDCDKHLFTAIQAVTNKQPEVHWHISNSPRSTATTDTQLKALSGHNISYVHWRECAPDWITKQLQQAQQVWVSEDSMSMVFEALTAGAHVGLLPMRRLKSSRLHKAIDQLLSEQMLSSYEQWQHTGKLKSAARRLDEASRCAEQLLTLGLFQSTAKP